MRDKAVTALDSLGEILPSNPGRDAIHLATHAVMSDEKLFPGQHIGFVSETKVGTKAKKPIGIVDPFLPGAVFPGQLFWLVLYPRSITSLRHVWTHPDFGVEAKTEVKPLIADKAASEKWLRDFIDRSNCPEYETVIAQAIDNSDAWDPSYLHFNGRDAHGEIPPEFWDHIEVVTGRTIPPADRAAYFSCSC